MLRQPSSGPKPSGLGLLFDTVACGYLHFWAEDPSYRTVLLFRKLDRPLHSGFCEIPSAHNVFDLYVLIVSWLFLSSRSRDIHLQPRDLLPLAFQDPDNIHACASSEPNEYQFEWADSSSFAAAFRVSIHRHGVPFLRRSDETHSAFPLQIHQHPRPPEQFNVTFGPEIQILASSEPEARSEVICTGFIPRR